jgi:hypothetical protein
MVIPLRSGDSSSFAHQYGESSTATLNGSECEWDLSLAVDIGIQNTNNMLELVWVKVDCGLAL